MLGLDLEAIAFDVDDPDALADGSRTTASPTAPVVKRPKGPEAWAA